MTREEAAGNPTSSRTTKPTADGLHAALGYRRTLERSPEFFDEHRAETAVEALIHHRAIAGRTAAITSPKRLTSCLMTW